MAKRVLTASIALVVALSAILSANPWPFTVLVIVIVVLGSLEIADLTGMGKFTAVIVAIAAVMMALALELYYGLGMNSLLGFWAIGAYSLLMWQPNYSKVSLFIVLWLVAGSVGAFFLQIQPIGKGAFVPNLLLFAITPLWLGDSAAYFIGKTWGKRKLAPSISPNKTIEGAVANLFGCMITAIAIGYWLEVPLVASVAVGLSTGVLGQVGDLLQSRFKRRADVKDSGSLLPGHGGILDRLDSFLFSSVPTLLLLLALSPELFHVKRWPL